MAYVWIFCQTYHLGSRTYYVKGTETAHFSPKTEIGPHGTVWAPRSQLLALGTSPGWLLLIMQPNMYCPPKVGFQISGHLTISTLKYSPRNVAIVWITTMLQHQKFLGLQGVPYVFAAFLVVNTMKSGENIWRTLYVKPIPMRVLSYWLVRLLECNHKPFFDREWNSRSIQDLCCSCSCSWGGILEIL